MYPQRYKSTKDFPTQNRDHFLEYRRIMKFVNQYGSIAARIPVLTEMGYIVGKECMGSGGVGQVRVLKSEVRVQISCGMGRGNRAQVVYLR